MCNTVTHKMCTVSIVTAAQLAVYHFVNFSGGLLPSSIEVWCLSCVLTIVAIVLKNRTGCKSKHLLN
jgi:hypothetical protein